jgi:hypothetical protein
MIKNDKRKQIDFRMNGNSQDQNIVSLKKNENVEWTFQLDIGFQDQPKLLSFWRPYLKQNKTKTRIENES